MIFLSRFFPPKFSCSKMQFFPFQNFRMNNICLLCTFSILFSLSAIVYFRNYYFFHLLCRILSFVSSQEATVNFLRWIEGIGLETQLLDSNYVKLFWKYFYCFFSLELKILRKYIIFIIISEYFSACVSFRKEKWKEGRLLKAMDGPAGCTLYIPVTSKRLCFYHGLPRTPGSADLHCE